MAVIMEPPMQKKRNKAFKRSFKTYIANYDELVEKYPDQHVALCDGEVIDHDRDIVELVKRIRENESVDLDLCMIEYIPQDKEDLLL